MFERAGALSIAALALLAIVPQAHAGPRDRIVIYLHGAILESQGPAAHDARYGDYEWAGIVHALGATGATVKADLRPVGTEVSVWADRVVGDVRAMLAMGIQPSAITVIGASKGAVIASLVSTRLRVRGVRYVLMGNCNQWLLNTWRPRLTGEVLSIYETSDRIGGSCKALAAQSPKVARFSEIRLSTGLGHGFLYRPLPAWVEPAAKWAARR